MRPRACARGNYQMRLRCAPAHVLASMRPRACARGNMSAITAPVSCTSSFNEAASVRSRKLAQLPPGDQPGDASMRPRACARGNVTAVSLLWARELASMRPRACARGNDTLCVNARYLQVASMRPRARARGNVKQYRNARGYVSFNEAASVRSRKFSGCRHREGLDHVASMRPRACARGNYWTMVWGRSMMTCFNEAASVRSRKSASILASQTP